MLTTKEVAERIGVKYPTVMLWIRERKLSGAVKETSPRGDYWLVPESSIVGIKKRGQGRPKKIAAADETHSDASVTAEKPAKPKKARKARSKK